MGTRRKFTREFKEEAVRRLGLGVSVAEVAKACEINANVLHRWRREIQEHGVKAFAGNGQRRADESQVAELERKVGRQALEIFYGAACSMSRSSGSCKRWISAARLPVPRKGNESGDTQSSGAVVPAGAGEPGRILPLSSGSKSPSAMITIQAKLLGGIS